MDVQMPGAIYVDAFIEIEEILPPGCSGHNDGFRCGILIQKALSEGSLIC